jgi:hypothetical protein
MVGINMFYGDLVDNSRTSYSFGVAFEREMNKILNIRSHLMFNNMKGTQMGGGENSGLVNAYFKDNIIDLGFGVNYRFVDHAFGYYKQRAFSSYAVGQLGVVYYNATEWVGPGINYHPEGSIWHQQSGVSPVITLGGGIHYWLSPRLNIRGELLANKPLTDYLDAHKVWDDIKGDIHKTDAGDFYYTATVGVSYLIKDSRWKNEPKYNRKAYMKLRNYNMGSSSSSRKKYKSRRR